MKKRFTKLGEWLTGERQPTLKQLEAFAKATHTPFGFLLLKSPPEETLPVPDFRTVANQEVSRPSPDLLETLHEMQRRQDWMRDYRLDMGAEPLPFIGSESKQNPPEKVANSIRATLGLEPQWAREHKNWEDALAAFKEAIQGIGVLVFGSGIVGSNTHRALNPEEFRGFVLCDPIAPLIFVNHADAKSARMFTLAHELVHLWLGQDALFNLSELQPTTADVEVFCNRVAAELLLPAESLMEKWKETRSKHPFDDLARYFKVSSLVVARRCLDLGLISRAAYQQHYEESIERFLEFKKKGDGGNYYDTSRSRLDPNFTFAIRSATRSGELLPTHAQRLVGMKGKTFERFLEGESMRGGRR